MAQEHDDKATALSSYWEFARSLGYIIPIVAIGGLAGGLGGTMWGYVGLNFFAQRHTDLDPAEIHCESDMTTSYCHAAVLDSTRFSLVMAVIHPIVEFVMLPAVGILSDAFGRWPLMLPFQCINFLAAVLGLCFIFFNTSLYWAFALQPLMQSAAGTVLFNSMAIDRIDNSRARSTAFGLIGAVGTFFSMLGLVLGSFMPMKAACCLSNGLSFITFLIFVLVMPETLPPERRLRNFTWHSLLPGVELGVLWRTPALRQLTAVLLWLTFVDSGWGRISPMYFQFKLNITAHDAYLITLAGNVSVVITLGVLFHPLLSLLGEVGMIAFDTATGIIGIIIGVYFLTQTWQAILTTFVTNGPAAISLPAIAGLKSMIVSEEEQGLMQAALNTVVSVVASIAVFAVGSVFDATNRPLLKGDPDVEPNRAAFLIVIPLYFPVFFMVWYLRDALKAEGIGMEKLESPDEAAAAADTGDSAAAEQLRRRTRAAAAAHEAAG